MSNPKAHAPNATRKRFKAKPIRMGPAEQPARDGSEHWQPGEAERPGYALIPTLTRAGLIWPDTYDPAIHGAPAERSGVKAALDPEWW